MLGLSMGSWLVGKALLYLKKTTKRSALLFYMLAEVVIGESSQPNVYYLRLKAKRYFLLIFYLKEIVMDKKVPSESVVTDI
jgi:hypothetical protein